MSRFPFVLLPLRILGEMVVLTGMAVGRWWRHRRHEQFARRWRAEYRSLDQEPDGSDLESNGEG